MGKNENKFDVYCQLAKGAIDVAIMYFNKARIVTNVPSEEDSVMKKIKILRDMKE